MTISTIPKIDFHEFLLRSLIKYFNTDTTVNTSGVAFNTAYAVTNAFNTENINTILKTKSGILSIEFNQAESYYKKGAGLGQFGWEIDDDTNKKLFYNGATYLTTVQFRLLTSNDLDRNNGTRKLTQFQSVFESIIQSQNNIPIWDYNAEPIAESDIDIKFKLYNPAEPATFTKLDTPPDEYKQGVYNVPIYVNVVVTEEGDIVTSELWGYSNQKD